MGWILAFIVVFTVLAYQRASLNVWTVGLLTYMILFTSMHLVTPSMIILWVIFAIIFGVLHGKSLRRNLITQYVLKFYRKNMPTMSTTEREALAAGTVSFEGELFKGAPNWQQLFQFAPPKLSEAEQTFIEGPVEKLCAMIDDWDIVHHRKDLPDSIWQFLKDEGFFAMIIPKSYGGKEFSAYAHSQILTKVYGKSTTVGTTIAVPNSLGPAELLLHYGTPEQKNYYLPRLAKGLEIPCFALTGLEAGSDAGAMTDTGIVEWGDFEGTKTLGLRLNWNKRYITLAPVATVIGLAFKMYDPNHLLGTKKSLGITCALIPRDTKGVSVGRRHLPCGTVFQNGPTEGHDVFIPLDWIIGGPAMVGQGWRMLMECLAAGRAISLPASAVGGAKAISFATSAYARIRQQFKIPIGRFEGVEEVLARIIGLTYIMDATRTFTANMIDLGAKPAVASAITKYHVTEFGRIVANDAMDIHGGKGIMLGPQNYLGQGYQAMPIAITVEGANILTRNMIIFGQGAMRCHPYIYKEFTAATIADPKERLTVFDQALWGHLGFTLTNVVRTVVLSLTNGRIVQTPKNIQKFFLQKATRFSAAFAFVADVCLLIYGGNLKRKENISARLGDILSYLYLLASVLKHYEDQGCLPEDKPIIDWAGTYCLWQIETRFADIFKNLPNRFVGGLLRALVFPFGKKFAPPTDRLSQKVAQLFLEPSTARYRLAEGVFTTNVPGNVFAQIDDAFHKVIKAEPIEKILKNAVSEGKIPSELSRVAQAKVALEQMLLNEAEANIIFKAEAARQSIIAVDDFAPEDLGHTKLSKLHTETYATEHPNGTEG